MDNNMPLVSVIMSVYAEPIEWLRLSIESILKQTYNNFEFIIINDNPQYFEGISLLNEYAQKDKRIKLVFNKENIGLTKSLNIGIKESQGKYIVRMDADDVSMPERIAKQVGFMENHSDIVASGTGCYQWNNEKEKIAHRRTKNKELRSKLIFDSPIYHPTAIFRRVVDDEIVKYDESFRYSQDYALWISLMEHHKLSNIDEPLIKYRISNQQISTAKHEEQNVYALRNQKNAMRMIGIVLSEDEHSLFQDYTRHPEIIHERKEIELLVVKFLNQVRKKNDIIYSVVANQLMLIYINRIANNYGLFSSLVSLLRMDFKIRSFSFYNLLSLMSKYF